MCFSEVSYEIPFDDSVILMESAYKFFSNQENENTTYSWKYIRQNTQAELNLLTTLSFDKLKFIFPISNTQKNLFVKFRSSTDLNKLKNMNAEAAIQRCS